MSKANQLTEYLIGENSFLLNDSNNGKTIMLSGVWGAGKTHFWKNSIEPLLHKKLLARNSAGVYVSLYGKDSLEAIKNEIICKAYLFQKGSNNADKVTSKAISAFGFGTRVLSSLSVAGIKIDSSKISGPLEDFFESGKIQTAEKYINNGGVICIDDLERKSSKIDLNDLFGFLSQLSIEMDCKVVIILNSDAFEGKDNTIFKNVKEKTINKYLNYSPTIEELFLTVFLQQKYSSLMPYKTTLLEVMKETKELNARIYIQVLDNCMEWLNKDNSESSLRALILSTVNFIKNHFCFDKYVMCEGSGVEVYKILLKFKNYYEIFSFLNKRLADLDGSSEEVIHQMRSSINRKDEKEQKSTTTTKSDQHYSKLNEVFDNNIDTFEAIYFYGYHLKIEEGTTNKEFIKINNFVQSGILL